MIPSNRAEKSVVAMWANDVASKWSGMSLDHADVGKAVMSFEVGPQYLNGQVTHPNGRAVAEFRGGSSQIKDQHFEEIS